MRASVIRILQWLFFPAPVARTRAIHMSATPRAEEIRARYRRLRIGGAA